MNWKEERPKPSNLNPQWLLNQMALVNGHITNKWRQVSSSMPHNEQDVSPILMYLAKKDLVGRQFAAILHKCIFSLSWILVFQISPLDASWLVGGFSLRPSQYADFTDICPLEVVVHIHLSACDWKEIRIFWIALTVCSSNKFLSLLQSYPLWLRLMSWDTIRALSGLEPSFGRGIKEGKSGIHGSNQVLIEFPLPTWKQALWAIRCFVPSMLLQVGDELPVVWWFNQPVGSNLILCS